MPTKDPTRSLAGAAVLVTGGSGGNGSAVARRLVAEGARVFLCGRDPVRTADIAASVGCPWWTGDLRERGAAQEAIDQGSRALGGRLDMLVAAAGSRGMTTDVASPVPEECGKIMADNVTTLGNTLTAALPVLSASPSSVFLGLSSLAGLTGYHRFPYYTAAKAATIGLLRAAVPGALRQGVSVRVLCLWFTDTPLIADVLPELQREGIPVQTADEVAASVSECLVAPGDATVWTSVPGGPATPYRFRRVATPPLRPDSAVARPPRD
ncbi:MULTISPECIES: SDR family oxidoreductase [unclassified Streptomyces]|uniref:SDR family oxidoreductase n=1 Tax=Streptomyces sp. NPDC127532 TaxID=3345399 RepID=UPI003643376C